MRLIPIAVLIALAATPASARRPEGEAALAAAIGDRVAGAPVACIGPQQIRSTQIVEGIGIVYDLGGTLYVQRPQGGARSLRSDDVLVTHIDGGQLCRLDTIQLFEPASRMQRGFVVLGSFVPYTRPRR